jgi:molecular chaperone GrpE
MPDEQIPVQNPELAPDAASGRSADTGSVSAEALAQLEKERDDYRDLLLRTRAEFDNYRKRVERERLEQFELASADLVRDLLPVVDDLERALAAPAEGEGGAEVYRRGVELIHRRLLDLLKQRGVTPIEALGTEFDPNRHEAVTHEAAPGRREGEVIEEYRRGYMIGSRLLRPSMVKVAAGA